MTFPLLLERWIAADSGDDDDRIHAGAGARLRGAAEHAFIIPADHPDAARVAAVRAGNVQAFEGIVVEYGPEVIRLAYALLGDWAEAEDAAQDVLLWVWSNRERWAPRAGIRPYLLRAASNRARNIRTTRETHHSLEQRHVAPFVEIATPAPGESEGDLWQAIHALPDRWREAILCRYVEGMPFADVGQVLGVSEDGAKKVVRRALTALRNALRDVGS